ncbi:MAG: PA2779 family protein [Gammaproteobacteria bacterium]
MKSNRLWILAGAAVTMCILSVVAGAEMVSTDQALGKATADQERARVQLFLNRTETQEKLHAMGIDAQAVKERVASLTDQEVNELARQLDTLPTGGDISNRNLIAILLIVLLVVLLI